MLNKDNIHFKRSRSLSINAMVYFWLSGRGPGKSTEAKELVLEEYKKNKETSRNLYFTLNENQSLKEYKTKYEDLNKSFNETLEEQKKPLLEENNTLKTENQNLKTENTENKKQLEKYQEFFTRVKKYYGDRFSDFLEKIKPKTTIKPK